ncbi:MAG: hypothetical protein HYZ01_06075 [Ignavibacteriales bacterium]|nr:hypothetical protein [Ignavibacteriales bacterium]
MKEITFRRAFGYCTMVGMLILGGLVLMGFVLNPQTPSRLRTMMGIVLLLFGIFRGLLLYSQRTLNHGKEEEA